MNPRKLTSEERKMWAEWLGWDVPADVTIVEVITGPGPEYVHTYRLSDGTVVVSDGSGYYGYDSLADYHDAGGELWIEEEERI